MKKNQYKITIPTDAAAIQEALKIASQQVKELEAENRRLKRELQKFHTQNKALRQRARSQAGQLRAAQAKVQTLRVSLRKARAALRVARATPIKSVTKRSRAQYLEQQKPAFIKRFIQRLHETYSDFLPEWDEVVRMALMSLAYDEIDGIMRMLNLDSMYYESNGYRTNAGATGRMIYEYFVQFIPQPVTQ